MIEVRVPLQLFDSYPSEAIRTLAMRQYVKDRGIRVAPCGIIAPKLLIIPHFKMWEDRSTNEIVIQQRYHGAYYA